MSTAIRFLAKARSLHTRAQSTTTTAYGTGCEHAHSLSAAHASVRRGLLRGQRAGPAGLHTRTITPTAMPRTPAAAAATALRAAAASGARRSGVVMRSYSQSSRFSMKGRTSTFACQGTRSRGAGVGRSRGLSSYLQTQGSGSGGKGLVYGLTGLNILGTLVWMLDTDGPLRQFLMLNTMVSTYSTLKLRQLHTLVTSNFSHSNLWNGAICSYMVYNVGSTAIQLLGARNFLALYFLGGSFAQLCQVAGPLFAHDLRLPSILEVHPHYFSDGGYGATLAMLSWYCFTFPKSQIILVVVPIQTGVAGALYLGATLYTLVTNGDSIPFLGGPPREIWRTLGAIAAGGIFALATRGRGRYQFMKKF